MTNIAPETFPASCNLADNRLRCLADLAASLMVIFTIAANIGLLLSAPSPSISSEK